MLEKVTGGGSAWSVDLPARSLQDLVALLGDVHAQGVDLKPHIQAIDTTMPGGKALFPMIGVFAVFGDLRECLVRAVGAGAPRRRASPGAAGGDADESGATRFASRPHAKSRPQAGIGGSR